MLIYYLLCFMCTFVKFINKAIYINHLYNNYYVGLVLVLVLLLMVVVVVLLLLRHAGHLAERRSFIVHTVDLLMCQLVTLLLGLGEKDFMQCRNQHGGRKIHVTLF